MSTDARATKETTTKPSMMPKFLVGGFISLIVIAETLIFFLMVPSADDVAALAESRLVEKLEARLKAKDEEVIDKNKAIQEFNLGQFGIPVTPIGSDSNYRVEFDLRGTVKGEERAKLAALFAEREGRFRHKLMMELRNATLEELKESQLGLIQRRILATSNEVFETPILLGVVFNNYDLIEE
ncbi:MAG: dihydrolipoamide acetyltransferase [Pirellulaceae bacterium]|nr:dihydrolipoamide acetyltransferase [Pirellulaceae bacterium]